MMSICSTTPTKESVALATLNKRQVVELWMVLVQQERCYQYTHKFYFVLVKALECGYHGDIIVKFVTT